MRSSPMPVSMDGLGRSRRVFSSTCSNCMKTRFQNSRKRSPSSSGDAGRAAGHAVALVVENLRAIAAGPGRAHRPEIAFMADDAVVGKAGDLLPQLTRLIVGVIDRDQQPVLGQADHLGDEIPGEGDGFFLEIIAEGEIAQHLEEGVVAGGVADIVEVVMLAAGAHAFLHRGGAAIGPLFRAREQVLELHHARIGEQQGGVVARHQRRGRHHGVAALGEEIQESGCGRRTGFSWGQVVTALKNLVTPGLGDCRHPDGLSRTQGGSARAKNKGRPHSQERPLPRS